MQKYKVFLNETKIVFLQSLNITLTKTTADFIEKAENKELSGWLDCFLAGKNAETVLEHSNPEKLFNMLRSSLIEIDAAGGVVKRDNKLLFIFRNGKWDLPKGKIEKKESIRNAALREVGEECGIKKHEIVKPLPSTFHIYKSPYKKNLGKWIFKETFWFEMKYDGIPNGLPQTEEDITEVKWVTPKKLNKVLENTYENLKPLISIYLPPKR